MKYLSPLEDHNSDFQDVIPLKEWSNRNQRRRTIKKRKRKSVDQLRILSQEFKKCAEWDKDIMSLLAKKTGLSEAQIYKWSWDQKKKFQLHDRLKSNKTILLCDIFTSLPDIPLQFLSNEPVLCIGTNGLESSEVIAPQHIDYELYDIQKNYRHNLESLLQRNQPSCGMLDDFLEEYSKI
jgi:hypothetical protein